MGDLREELIRLAEEYRKRHLGCAISVGSAAMAYQCVERDLRSILARHPAPSPSVSRDAEERGDWWCPRCKEALDPSRVTFQERCDTCGTDVEWVPVVEDPTPDAIAPWYLADGSTVMLPAEEVDRRRKLAAKVLAQARAFRADFEAHGREGVALSNIRPIFAALDDLDAAAPSPRSKAEGTRAPACHCGDVLRERPCPFCSPEAYYGAGRAPVPAESATRCTSDGTDIGRRTCDCPKHAATKGEEDGQ